MFLLYISFHFILSKSSDKRMASSLPEEVLCVRHVDHVVFPPDLLEVQGDEAGLVRVYSLSDRQEEEMILNTEKRTNKIFTH